LCQSPDYACGVSDNNMGLKFEKETVIARFVTPDGLPAKREIEVRTNPITGRKSRIAFSRLAEKERGAEALPPPPPDAAKTFQCPFCHPQVTSRTPQIHPAISASQRLAQGTSLLFPNLFPYGRYSAVSLFDRNHFVEIGKASLAAYTASFINCGTYLRHVLAHEPEAVYMAITQNHLPSAGGSLVHPHLQVHADRIAANHHVFLEKRAARYFRDTGTNLFSDLLHQEKKAGERYIGSTGLWEWTCAYAPEGFFEIWGILPEKFSFCELTTSDWQALATGVLHTQRFYRSLCRNGYNLGMLFVEKQDSRLELRVIMLARSNYAAWVRNDHTGYEVMLGDMTTFSAPEQTAELARPFWQAACGTM
jgi:UDPglucose--hexose-1-phosphate uridylyltransferase